MSSLRFRLIFAFISLAVLASTVNTADAATPVSKHVFGAYAYGSPDDNLKAFNAMQTAIGHNLGVVHWFQDWSTPFDSRQLAVVANAGKTPLITWEPPANVSGIATGKYDAYLKASALQAKKFNRVLYLRPFAEMNGSWEIYYGNPKTEVAAWRHIVTVFRAAGATNVRWVWSPNENDDPSTAANRMELYYPGTAYVDVLAFDGYNWGSDGPNGWRTFDQVVAAPYKRIAALGPQPTWIAEIASSPNGGDKAAWISNMFVSASHYHRLQAIIWFNENKEQDWRLAATTRNATATRTSIGRWAN